jgi:hypothetical protein
MHNRTPCYGVMSELLTCWVNEEPVTSLDRQAQSNLGKGLTKSGSLAACQREREREREDKGCSGTLEAGEY